MVKLLCNESQDTEQNIKKSCGIEEEAENL